MTHTVRCLRPFPPTKKTPKLLIINRFTESNSVIDYKLYSLTYSSSRFILHHMGTEWSRLLSSRVKQQQSVGMSPFDWNQRRVLTSKLFFNVILTLDSFITIQMLTGRPDGIFSDIAIDSISVSQCQCNSGSWIM